MGVLKNYDVAGKEIDGRIMPAGTVLRLDEATAERYGLIKPARQVQAAAEPGAADPAETKKRRAPAGGRRPRT